MISLDMIEVLIMLQSLEYACRLVTQIFTQLQQTSRHASILFQSSLAKNIPETREASHTSMRLLEFVEMCLDQPKIFQSSNLSDNNPLIDNHYGPNISSVS